MPDILSVCMQDFLYSRKSELREQIIRSKFIVQERGLTERELSVKSARCYKENVGVNMVHLYKNNGYNMVLDVNSGSIHVVDDVVYDVLELLNEAEDRRKEEGFRQEITDKMLAKYGEDITAEDMKDVFEDLDELEENGTLFTEV